MARPGRTSNICMNWRSPADRLYNERSALMSIDWFPLWLSLRVAGFATVISLAISLYVAYLLANRDWRGKEILDAVTTLPLLFPPPVLAHSSLLLLGPASR